MNEHEPGFKPHENDLKRVIEAGSLLKSFSGWVIAVIALVINIIFWVQTQGSDKYYQKLAGENLEKQLTHLEQKFDNLENGNKEIIKLLGRLEAGQERNDWQQ